jgi:HlyD family secretion protein
MRKVLIPGVLILALALFVFFRYWKDHENNTRLSASGTIEATEVDIAPKITGRIDTVNVDEGDRTEAGQILVLLDGRELAAKAGAAEASVGVAEANLKNLLAGSRDQEIKKAEAALQEAEADLEKARTDWDRADGLHAEKLTSDQDWETARRNFDVAKARRREALESLDLVTAGTRREEIEAARAELKRARASLDLATAELENTRLLSPINGTVLLRNREPGETASPEIPVLTVGDLDHLWVTIYIRETDLGRIKLNQEAEVSVDAFPGRIYPGRVSYISDEAEFTPKTIQSPEERIKLVFRVKVAVENKNGELKPGMPADVKLQFAEGAK